LIVEDDPDSRQMLELILKRYGVTASTVETAAEALDFLESDPPDLLISDIGLPSEDGYDLIRKVRALRPERGGLVPAIAMTGYVSVQDRTLAIEAGYQEHLPKPIETDKLIDLVRGLVNGQVETAN
jgi:CheY-like chemotaxis protein